MGSLWLSLAKKLEMCQKSNLEMEMCWIDAWSDLLELVGTRQKVKCLLPDGRIVSVADCQGWLQESAYEGYQLQVAAGWVGGKRGIIVNKYLLGS